MKKILIVLTAMLLLIAACDTDSRPDGSTPFIGGTQGLEIEFLDSFPPPRVSDGGEDPFDVIIRIKNEGEANVAPEDVRLTLSGFPSSAFGLSPDNMTKNSPELIEMNEINPDGSIVDSVPVEVEFLGFAYQDLVQGNQPFTFRADICYSYNTRVTSTLCVKEDFRRDVTGDVCAVSATRQALNSGAPVQVTSMSQTAAGSERTRISFTVANRGTGHVYEVGRDCASDARREDRVFVRVLGFDESLGEEINCRGLRDSELPNEGFVVLGSEGRVDVTCDISFDERSPRIQPFSLELHYDYNKNIQKQVVVERN